VECITFTVLIWRARDTPGRLTVQLQSTFLNSNWEFCMLAVMKKRVDRDVGVSLVLCVR
jgi:hypothetical protein